MRDGRQPGGMAALGGAGEQVGVEGAMAEVGGVGGQTGCRAVGATGSRMVLGGGILGALWMEAVEGRRT